MVERMPQLTDDFVRSCFFFVAIDGHKVKSARASIEQAFEKPTHVVVSSSVRVEGGKLDYQLASFYDGKPHTVQVYVCDRDHNVLGTWTFADAKPIARCPGRWDNASSEPLTERVVFESEVPGEFVLA